MAKNDGFPGEFPSAAEYELVLLDSARRFVILIWRNFTHKRSIVIGWRKNILEQLCGVKDD